MSQIFAPASRLRGVVMILLVSLFIATCILCFRLLASSSTPVPKSVKPPSAYKPASTSQDHPEVIDQSSVDSNRPQVESHSSKMRLLEVPQEVTRVASPSPDGTKVPTDLQSKKVCQTIQSTLGFETLDKAAALGLATSKFDFYIVK